MNETHAFSDKTALLKELVYEQAVHRFLSVIQYRPWIAQASSRLPVDRCVECMLNSR